MLAGVLGIAGFFLAIATWGSVAEGNGRHTAIFGGALAACIIIILTFTEPRGFSDKDCWIDWDGRSNTTVCR